MTDQIRALLNQIQVLLADLRPGETWAGARSHAGSHHRGRAVRPDLRPDAQ